MGEESSRKPCTNLESFSQHLATVVLSWSSTFTVNGEKGRRQDKTKEIDYGNVVSLIQNKMTIQNKHFLA